MANSEDIGETALRDYENAPMQYTDIFFSCKNCKFHWKKLDIYDILGKNIHPVYTLEPPRRGGSNEYSQCMFWIENKKITYNLSNPSFFLLFSPTY